MNINRRPRRYARPLTRWERRADTIAKWERRAAAIRAINAENARHKAEGGES